MNYDEARKLRDGGWHWTSMNDGCVRTAAPCIRHVGDESKPFWYLELSNDADWERCDPHASREEAERHFYDYSLAQVTEHEYDQATRCAVDGCSEWANKTLANGGMSLYFTHGPNLCDAHRTREQLALIQPFKPGISLIHS